MYMKVKWPKIFFASISKNKWDFDPLITILNLIFLSHWSAREQIWNEKRSSKNRWEITKHQNRKKSLNLDCWFFLLKIKHNIYTSYIIFDIIFKQWRNFSVNFNLWTNKTFNAVIWPYIFDPVPQLHWIIKWI